MNARAIPQILKRRKVNKNKKKKNDNKTLGPIVNTQIILYSISALTGICLFILRISLLFAMTLCFYFRSENNSVSVNRQKSRQLY